MRFLQLLHEYDFVERVPGPWNEIVMQRIHPRQRK